MELYLRTIQAVCHYNTSRQNLPDLDWDDDLIRHKEFIWKYWMTGKFHFSIPNEIHCGDIITTDENGKILTVNGKEYIHTI